MQTTLLLTCLNIQVATSVRQQQYKLQWTLSKISVAEKYTNETANKGTIFRLTNLRAALEQCKNMFMLGSCGLMQPGQHVTEVPQWIV